MSNMLRLPDPSKKYTVVLVG